MNPAEWNYLDRETLLAHAYAIEHEAAERYQDLAAQMHDSNNVEVGGLFAKLAEVEAKHAAELSLEHGAAVTPAGGSEFMWDSLESPLESPEAIAYGDMHYLMTPRHALTLALAAEQRALSFYEDLAARAPSEDLRVLAAEFAAEEAEHVRMVQEWLQRLPEDEADWDDDMDPPVEV